MKRWGLLSAIAVVLAANLAALWSAASNRAGDPEAKVEVTERDLRLVPLGDENTGLAMRLEGANWRNGALWLDRAKLAELGFDTGRRRVPPREAFVALEYSDQHGLMVAEVAQRAATLRQRFPDRRRFIVTRCLVRMTWRDQQVKGIIPELLVSELHVPLPLSRTLAGFPAKYNVTLCYGRNYEPWICDCRVGRP